MKKLHWKVAGYDRRQAVRFVKAGYNPLVSVLLASRGIQTEETAKMLTDPSEALLTDPMDYPDMEKAVSRILRAMQDGEKIAVYGDYDVDGITSSSIVAEYLRNQGVNCNIYIPNRLTEGYGVKKGGIDVLHEKGVSLIITVDCGITAFEESTYAASLGMDLVITDHHECADGLPEAVAVVNPKRSDTLCGKELAGVGVAFKLVCALAGKDNVAKVTEQFCDLVAVGTIADVMPMSGENRWFIRKGLQSIKAGQRPGLQALCQAAGIEKDKLSATAVGFALAPRINAAGRLGKTEVALELILAKSRAQADMLAEKLCALNRERQNMEGAMFNETMAMVSQGEVNAPLVLSAENWHQGIAGIVASRISEKYNVPVVMICLSDDIGRGSCRSARGFNIFEALQQCRDLLIGFGGHEMAAGLTVKRENIDLLQSRLAELYEAKRDRLEEPSLAVDFEVIKPGLLNVNNISGLRCLEPYGNKNPIPMLAIRGARVETVAPLSGGKHTKFSVSCWGETYECIAFSHTAEEMGLSAGVKVQIAFTPQVNEFRGRSSVQLLVADVEVYEG